MHRFVLTAFVLALAASPAQAAPRYDPEVETAMALLDAGRRDDWQREMERLADRPGVRPFLDGILALRSGDGANAGWTAGCAKWEEAASLLAQAAHFAAECYEKAYDGRPRDMARAMSLYGLAAEGGYGKSWCAMGNIHFAGKGVPKDEAKGVALCARGADMGDRDAQTDLGIHYLMGTGVARDSVRARALFEPAAAAGNRNAAFLLGQIHWKGDGTPKDNAAAQHWWKRAYDLGRTDASALLAREALVRGTRSGQVDPAALREAEGWYAIALALDPPHPEKAKLEQELTVVRASLAARR